MSAKDKEEEVEKGAMDNKEKEESSKEKVNSDKTEDGKSKDDQDVVFVQDVGFTVKIIAPNLEPFDIQVQYGEAKLIPFIYTKWINFASPYCIYLYFVNLFWIIAY